MKILIYGKGDFAQQMLHYLSTDSHHEAVAFCVDAQYMDNDDSLDLKVISFETVLQEYPADEYKFLIAVGYSDMRSRETIYNKVKDAGYTCINFIHSTAIIDSSAVIGENNIILASCVVEPFVHIGDNNIIWSMSLIGHHAQLQNHNYISAKCLIAGGVKLRNLCFIGNGVTMINNLEIANETYLVAGTNLRKSTQELGMYIGNPAKLLKQLKNGIKIT